MLFFPLLLILTPSPTKSTQSILYALSAPVRHGPIKQPAPIQLSHPAQPLSGDKDNKKKEEEEVIDPRRSGVGGGDVVRDCAVVEYVPPSSFFLLPSYFFPPSIFLSPPLTISLSYHTRQALSCPAAVHQQYLTEGGMMLIPDSLPSYVIH
jgi:hypothetical protein